MFFLITINFIIINYISKLTKFVNSLYLVLLFSKLDLSNVINFGELKIFLKEIKINKMRIKSEVVFGKAIYKNINKS